MQQPRWRGPKSSNPRRTAKYKVTLHHSSLDSSLKTPYAPRKVQSASSSTNYSAMGYPKVVRGKPMVVPPYDALNDPHLTHYYTRKFGVLSESGTTPTAKSRPLSGLSGSRRASSRLDGSVPYEVTVMTGDRHGAGTEARVFLSVQGTVGKIRKTLLSHLQQMQTLTSTEASTATTAMRFLRNSAETFVIRGPEIGEPVQLHIAHDGLEERHSWFLEEIHLAHPSSQKAWRFPCRRWISLHKTDCQLSRELVPVATSAKRKLDKEKNVYDILVVTGDVRGAGTDANVFLTVFGEAGSTPKTKLANGHAGNFERGKEALFRMRCSDLGGMRKIRIEHDNTGFGPGWFLDRVSIRKTGNDSNEDTRFFNCGTWLARDEGDGEIARDIPVSRSAQESAKILKYIVTTHTGSVRGSGTDANVSITIFGKLGDTGERRLDNNKNNFERNRVDQFALESPFLGEVERVRISHDNSGLGPGWYLSKVTVEDPSSGKSYNFACSRWLAKDEDDGQISRELHTSEDVREDAPNAGIPYRVSVTTGDKRNAGTDANVYLVMFGKDSEGMEVNSGKIQLDNRSKNFVRGRTDIFNVETLQALSPLTKIAIGHDNRGLGAGWYLDEVVVDCPSSGHCQVFPCHAWLDKSEKDGLIERELYEEEDERTKRSAKSLWSVCIWTTDMRGAGTDATVSMQVYGDKGKTDLIVLQNQSDNFEQGELDKFKLEFPEIGRPYKLRIEHDNSGPFPGWHLDKVHLENIATGERLLFLCHQWLDRNEEDGELVRELAVEGDGLALKKYDVSVFTGTKRGAGTDANVFLEIFGERGDTGRRQLRVSKTNKNKFEKSKCDEFTIEAVSLGEIRKLRIGHDGTGPGAGWFLDKVVVKDADKLNEFNCQRWLSSTEDDGQIVRELFLNPQQSLLQTTSYHLSVRTGDCRHAGTDATVSVCLWGPDGDTGRRELKHSENSRNKFERGRVDKFTIENADIGKVERLWIGHDGSGPGSGWYLDDVTVDVPSRGERFVFSCDRWLAKSEDDGRIELELYPKAQQIQYEKKLSYGVSAHTGDVRGAGTDANVFLVLYGESGKSDQLWLQNKTDNFERGQVDAFKVEAKDVGDLTKIRVGHDGKGVASGWFLNKIVITCDRSSNDEDESSGQTWSFPCERWLSRGEDDGEIVRELVPENSASSSSHSYGVLVVTGDVRGSGTDSNVYVTLYGDKGDTGERHLRSSELHSNKFERGHEDKFTLEAVDLGKLSKVKVRHDNSGLGSNWYLERIEITDQGDSEERASVFPCRQWLSKSHGDGMLSRELVRDTDDFGEVVDQAETTEIGGLGDNVEVVATPEVLKGKAGESIVSLKRNAITYNLSVVTGNVKGAGTDANVFIVLYGEEEDTGFLPLTSSKTHRDKFEREQTDEFVLEAKDIGKIKKLRIGHDNKGGSAGWFLEKVIIDAPVLGTRQTFLCNRWLDKSEDDCALERELFPLDDVDVTYEPHVRYEVTTYTSDLRGAGTDAAVFIVLHGETTQTAALPLSDKTKKKKDCFERSSVDVCHVEGIDVGPSLRKVRIGHDGKGFGAGWHLEKVEVKKLSEEDPDSHSIYTFLCGRWLATSEDDGAIVRELVPSLETVVKKDKDDGKLKVLSLKRKDALDLMYYKVLVSTGDVKGAGTDANVFLTMYGDVGDSGERKLRKSETHRNKFERGQEDIFVVEAAHLGRLQKVKIRHDNSSFKKAWYLDRITVQAQDDGDDVAKEYVFYCERWLAKDKEDGRIERQFTESTYVEENDVSALDEMSSSVATANTIPYTVRVTTASGRDSGTDGRAFVVFIGDVCTSEKVELELLSRDQYLPGKTETFSLEAVDVGKIEKIRLGHDGTSSQSDWLVKDVEVDMPTRGQHYYFPFDQWLARDKSGGVAMKEIKPATRQFYPSRIPYEISVVTGDQKDAGLDSSVFFSLHGARVSSEATQLEKMGKRFERGRTDKIKVDIEDVGVIKKLRVWHEGRGERPSWFLDKFVLKNLDSGTETTFICNNWLSKTLSSDGALTRDFAAMTEKDQAAIQHTSYQIDVKTGDIFGAGTDANVFLILFGENGDSGELALSSSSTHRNKFERNQIDIFSFPDLLSLGHLSKLRVWHDNKGMGASWFLDSVDVVDSSTDAKYHFACGRWLSKGEDDGNIVRELTCSGNASSEESGLNGYEISVTTGDKKGSGTGYDMGLVLVGETGKSKVFETRNREGKRGLFQRGGTDVFQFASDPLGKLTAVEVRHFSGENQVKAETASRGNSWHLHEISVCDTGNRYVFLCKTWLPVNDPAMTFDCTKVEGGRTSEIRSLNPVQYEVQVVTGDESRAGTDANVYVTILGENGDTGRRHLTQRFRNLFERGRTDVFTVEALDLGRLTALKIEHDNKGVGAGWLLDKVIVKNKSSDEMVEFPCSKWLDKKKGDGQICRTLLPL